MALKAGDRLGPYEILAPIGAGGMGEVWKARDRRLDRVVAIKVSAAFSERFEREAKAVTALNHPSICQIYDVGPDHIVMEYVEGTPITPVDTPRKLLDMAFDQFFHEPGGRDPGAVDGFLVVNDVGGGVEVDAAAFA